MVGFIALLLAGIADTPVPPTLLREPVRVEIVTDGRVETPPDRFRITGMLITRGVSLDTVQAELDKRHAAIVREMAALGATVSPPEGTALFGFIGNEQYADGNGGADSDLLAMPDQLRFDAADRASADRVAEALKKDGVAKPMISGILLDDTAAVDRARVAALAQAYAKAQRSASSLGMHVSALRRISDQAESPDRYVARLAGSLGPTIAGNVVTRATLLVEFELTPTP